MVVLDSALVVLVHSEVTLFLEEVALWVALVVEIADDRTVVAEHMVTVDVAELMVKVAKIQKLVITIEEMDKDILQNHLMIQMGRRMLVVVVVP